MSMNFKPHNHEEDFSDYRAKCDMPIDQQAFVEVWKLNEKGYYELYHTRF